MKLFKERGAAYAVLAAAIIFSLLFGAHRSLSALRADVEAVFARGAKGDGLGIAYDLSEQAKLAVNLSTSAEEYLGPSAEEIAAAREAAAALERASSPGEKYDAAQTLTAAFTDLIVALRGAGLSKENMEHCENMRKSFDSHATTMQRDPYNAMAAAFNEKTLGAFPASVLGPLTGVQPLELFA